MGSADFCLTCPNQQLASSGQCVSTCPGGTFSASGTCLKCHPDCASCSGSSFNACSACPPERPVLSSNRCLPTCGRSKFFDLTSSTCESCDPSCSSCSGSGSTNCLACSSNNDVLRAGSCVSANCTGSTSVVPSLGVCLSELVQEPPLPTITTTSSTISSSSSVPIPSSPTVPVSGHRPQWWQILLMVFGGVFVLILILMLWRRFARRQRAEETVMFASAKQIDGSDGWRWRLKQFKNMLFGGKKGGYDLDDPPMTSYGDSVTHRDSISRTLDVELRSPMTHYLDDALSSRYPFPKSIHHRRPSTKSKDFPSTNGRLGSRSSARGRSNDPSPTRTRDYRSNIRSLIRHPPNNRSPSRGYRSDDHSPTRLYYLSDDSPSTTKEYRSDKRPSIRRHHSDKRSLTRGNRSDDHSLTREYPSLVRSRTREREYPTREREYPTREREYPTREREHPPREREHPTREREYPTREREHPSIVRSPSTSHYPFPLKERWEDRLDNSLSRYPRMEKDGRSLAGASLAEFFSPPPSYPTQNEHARASLAALR